MKKHIETSIIIKAAPTQVWKVFTDFESYPEWNPFIHKLEGTPKVDSSIKIYLPGMTFKPKVLAFATAKELRWLGKLLFKGLFDGEHYFKLEENADGSTTFIHGEQFSGMLVGMFAKKLDSETKPGFEAMNLALKQKVEACI